MTSKPKRKKTVRHTTKQTEATAGSDTLLADLELDTKLHSQSSEPFVGQWNNLVSTTNWEKGLIISEWRNALIAQKAPASQCSDEAWCQLVNGVTSQHVGRLRRVYQIFGESRKDYEGLYWSHFCAAVDWSDPELWLEGAIQNSWSVSQMRKQRWEVMGKVPGENPDNDPPISTELDEDFEPAINTEPKEKGKGSTGPLHEGPDFGEEQHLSPGTKKEATDGSKIYSEDDDESVEFVRPFANIGEMPDDLMEAFDAFKLAVLHHKSDEWQQVSRDDVLASLDALKELAKAPAADNSTF